MIYIQKNTENKVVLTLCESSTLLSPFYLFNFLNTSDPSIEVLWSGPDFSTSVNRYNLFKIQDLEGGGCTEGQCVGPLDLKQGQWTYRVYEASASTLEISATTGSIVESGRMMVSSNDFFNDNTISDANGVYL